MYSLLALAFAVRLSWMIPDRVACGLITIDRCYIVVFCYPVNLDVL